MIDRSYLVGVHSREEGTVMRVYETEASEHAGGLALPNCVAIILGDLPEATSDVLDIVTIERDEPPTSLVSVTRTEAAQRALDFMEACPEPHADISSPDFARELSTLSPDFAQVYDAEHPGLALDRIMDEDGLTLGYY